MARDMTIQAPTLTAPEWTNTVLGPEHLLPSGVMLDPAQFVAPDAVRLTVGSAGAAASATSIPLDAPIPTGLSIPNGTPIDFGGARQAILTAPAAAGESALTVRALGVAIPAGATATYAGLQPRRVRGSTIIGRTYAERDAGTPFGPIADGDEEVYVVAFDLPDVTRVAWATVAMPWAGVTLKENHMYQWPSLTAAQRLLVRTRFNCQLAEA